MSNSDSYENNSEESLEINDTEIDILCEQLTESILRSRIVLDDKLRSMLYKLDDIECKLGVLKTSLETSVKNHRFRCVTTLKRKQISKDILLRKSPSLPSLKRIYGKERATEYPTSESENDEDVSDAIHKTSVEVISIFTRSKRASR